MVLMHGGSITSIFHVLVCNRYSSKISCVQYFFFLKQISEELQQFQCLKYFLKKLSFYRSIVKLKFKFFEKKKLKFEQLS
jgi:hypothetical protein